MPIDITRYASLLAQSRVRVHFGRGALTRVGAVAAECGATRVLVVTDPGIVRAGHAQRALDSLRDAGLEATCFHGVRENPTTREVEAGLTVAREMNVDCLIGLGGGSSMDCAKGINFLFSNGGRMEDYWGVGKAAQPMLPGICVPTTAGTGSEAQSFALITEPLTHQKMACGDEKALPRAAILDPDLVATVPRPVAAATGIDAVAHAIETAGCRTRTAVSLGLSQAAWSLLNESFETALAAGPETPDEDAPPMTGADDDMRATPGQRARAGMLLGAHLAGAAIEKCMLGAAHAAANPLTARFDITHGVAVGLMLPHVIRFNAAGGENPYAPLCDVPAGGGAAPHDAESLAQRVEALLDVAGLPRRLRTLTVSRDAIGHLAGKAAAQWTAKFNPRDIGATDFAKLYESAW